MKITKVLFGAIAAAALAIPAFASSATSGLAAGEIVTPFHPTHVTGPDAGTNTCPPCKYGNSPMVQVWVNGDSMENIGAIAGTLNKMAKENKDFKAFVIFLTDDVAATEAKLKKVAKDTGFNDIAMAYVPKDSDYLQQYKINTDPEVKNTVLVYRDRKVTKNFTNVTKEQEHQFKLTAAINAVL
ncbi:MAG: hypothetical protein ACOCX1_01075 [Fimbriimonadaceae bacterium]